MDLIERTDAADPGTEGNERLTVITGHALILLLAALGVTIVAIGRLMWLHLFLGLVLIGPVALKLASTGHRFVRYYTGDPRYLAKGPPPPALRMLGPVVVALTVAVLASGVGLLVAGPGSGAERWLSLAHKASFLLWLAATAIHVVGHLPELVRMRGVPAQARRRLAELRAGVPGFASAVHEPPGRIPGSGPRWLSLSGAIVVGLLLALSLSGRFGPWTHWRHGRDGGAAAAVARR
ncbi:MAG TPA: hypothetical protein VKV27_06860 [Solirubrobacteraceae bacterium]|nr:hypothetical protein [Solirubrobacteraceae bacterium]